MGAISPAKIEDLSQVMAFCYKTFGENELEEFGLLPDYDRLAFELGEAFFNGSVFVLRNEKEPSLVDGVIVLKDGTVWWSSSPCLASALFFIKKEQRSFKTAHALLKAAQNYAIIQGRPLIVDLVDKKIEDTKRKKKLLRFVGFEEVGSLFIFNPHSSNSNL